MTVIFVGKCLKFSVDFENGKKDSEKKLFFEIIGSELVPSNCLD